MCYWGIGKGGGVCWRSLFVTEPTEVPTHPEKTFWKGGSSNRQKGGPKFSKKKTFQSSKILDCLHKFYYL